MRKTLSKIREKQAVDARRTGTNLFSYLSPFFSWLRGLKLILRHFFPCRKRIS
jgi:hypothetical protein